MTLLKAKPKRATRFRKHVFPMRFCNFAYGFGPDTEKIAILLFQRSFYKNNKVIFIIF
jgi:hypothetical protein